MQPLRKLGVLKLFLLAVTVGASAPVHAQSHPATAIAEGDVIQPAALVARLGDTAQPTPLVLQVGAHVLYVQGHIPGSQYVGAGSTPDGLKSLRARVSKLAKDFPIVLYCGCCPWSRCPNIGPAYEELRREGYRNVKALYIANDFGTDWVDHGYPVAQGE